MKLGQHFDLDEFTTSETAERKGIANDPPQAAIQNLMSLCDEILEPLRAAVGRPITITSGYRSPGLNAAIGGSAKSQHCHGLAADIKVSGMTAMEVCQKIDELKLDFDQLIHEFGAWTHVSIAPDGREPRRQRLTIDRQGSRPGLLPVRK